MSANVGGVVINITTDRSSLFDRQANGGIGFTRGTHMTTYQSYTSQSESLLFWYGKRWNSKYKFRYTTWVIGIACFNNLKNQTTRTCSTWNIGIEIWNRWNWNSWSFNSSSYLNLLSHWLLARTANLVINARWMSFNIKTLRDLRTTNLETLG